MLSFFNNKNKDKRAGVIEAHSYRGISYTLEYKPIKRLNLRLKQPNGQVVISAPRQLTLKQVEAFIEDNLEWIHRQQERLQQLPAAPEHQYVTGETIYIWGHKYTLQLMQGPKVRLGVAQDTLYMYLPREGTREQRQALLDSWLKQQLEKQLPVALDRCSRVVGKEPTSWYVRKMKTRWGTCNVRTGRVCINLNLVHLHPEFLMYIVTHELNHLWVPNHGPDFKKNMDSFYPKWRQAREALKKLAYMV